MASVGVGVGSLQLTKIPLLEKLSSRVFRVLGCNASPVTLQGTNTYIVGTGTERILIDTGSPDVPQYVEQLTTALNQLNCTIRHVVLTHWHWDHTGGVSAIASSVLKDRAFTLWKYPTVTGDEKQIGDFKYQKLDHDQVLQVEGGTLQAIFTPGHTDDHVCILLREEQAVFSGDCVLGESSTSFETLGPYMQSLRALLALSPSVIYPGHGAVIKEPVRWLREYLSHREKREQQVMEVMKQQGKACSLNNLADIVYKDVAEAFMNKARSNLEGTLLKLKEDKRVELEDDLWKLVE